MKIISLYLFCFFISNLLIAQQKPFPQNVNYGFGFQPSSISNATITTTYNKWKTPISKNAAAIN